MVQSILGAFMSIEILGFLVGIAFVIGGGALFLRLERWRAIDTVYGRLERQPR